MVVLLLVLVTSFYGLQKIVFAEVDPAKLMEILGQLAGTWVTTPSAYSGTSSPVEAPKKVITPEIKEVIVPEVKKIITEPKKVVEIKELPVDKAVESIVTAPKIIKATSATKPEIKILKIETGDKKATFTFGVQNDTSDIQKFQFIYADQNGAGDTVITYNKDKIRKNNGNYVWYISNLSLSKYTVSITWVNASGETIPWVLSQPFTADLSLLAAGKCIIPNVSGMKVLSKNDKSILYWNKIAEATKYKVYKKNKYGEYIFVAETDNHSYTVNVSNGTVKYEEFSVKAVCSDGTESVKFSPSTNIRTGPVGLIILVLISGIVGWLIVRKRQNNLWKY